MSTDLPESAAPLYRRSRREAESASREARRTRGWVSFLRDVIVIVIIAVLVSFLVKTFVVRSFFIPSASMEDTLVIDDRILVDELTPNWTGYSHGDVVVFRDPGGWLPPTPAPDLNPFQSGVDWLLGLVGLSMTDQDDHLVKRIIGLPGDHVVCCNALGQMSINGVPVDELGFIKLPAGSTEASKVPFDVTVPEGRLWVMGDNRNNSQDSRFNTDQPGEGFVPLDNVVGKVFLRTWPFDRFGAIDGQPDVFAGVPASEDVG
ncbi:signal peptidase I [Microbacterium stercoris]|uniref:Signal peptidase I n=1 Tax=Microbacterium stercoris TaxID=2820289 RepID=A0A939TQZ9_9MICO|nr:signal peptidase I [Microbacterium stercoris]MBO3663990.1 signal peptidase I [Microbacterium stercoris]